MRKIIAIITLCCFFLFGSAQYSEASPGVIVAGAVAVGAVALTVGAATYYKPATTGSLAVPDSANFYANPVTGGIGRMLVAQWNTQTQYLQSQLQSKLVQAKVGFSSLLAAVKASPGTYPQLHAAMTTTSAGYIGGVIGANYSVTLPAGTVVKVGSTYYTLGSNVYQEGPGAWGNPLTGDSTGFYVPNNRVQVYHTPYYYNGGTSAYYKYCKFYSYTASSSVAPPPSITDKSPSEFVAGIGGSQVGSAYRGEIDSYIAGPDWSVNIVDSATADDESASPFVAPVVAPVPEVSGLGSSTTAAAQNRLVGASAAVASAQSAVAAAQAAYDANPTPENLAALNAAAAALTAATAEKTAAQAAADSATAAEAEKYPGAPQDPKKRFSWEKLKQLKDAMANIWPFSLLAGLAGYLDYLVADPVAPVFNFAIFGHTLTLDLSLFDPLAAAMRWVLALVIMVAFTQRIIAWYKGDSGGM